MIWAVFSKNDDSPLWLGENKKDMEKVLNELNLALGDRFYLDVYIEERQYERF